MKIDSQSRKWQVTINNPAEKGFTHDFIKEQIKELKNVIYWCMCDEISESKTYHTHFFIVCLNGVRFSRMKKLFEGAHFEMARGTSQENREYIRKEGKWEKDAKKETNLIDTFEEYGEMPIERQGQRNDIHDLYDMIRSGMTNFDIIEQNPEYMMHLDKIEKTRQIIREEEYKRVFRKLEVTYIWGSTGSGKTRGVMEKYGYENVYRITDYQHPFDGYKGQDVIVFEEFRSSLKISEMLLYLDGYPTELPCRYFNKVACFTKVYILTNHDLESQYRDVQLSHPETWLAFKRRINDVVCMDDELLESDIFEGEYVAPYENDLKLSDFAQ